MSHSRLTLAVDSGLVTLPDAGQIAVFGARSDSDLSALPQDRCHLVQGFKPDHDALATAGWQVSPDIPDTAALAVVFLPRAKAQARDTLARAAALCTGALVVDGAKTDGIDSIFKDLRKRGTTSAALSKSHGKLFTLAPGADLSDWLASASQIDGQFITAPGVFSADAVDPASKLLADSLPASLKGHIVDLGAGWGYLASRLSDRAAITRLDLVEADHAALTCARQNITDPRAHFHWADATTWKAPARIDHVVMNPPFHTSRTADPALGRAFIAAAARMLAPSGTLWLVANRHLPYESALSASFGETREIAGDNRFKILAASRPARQRR